MWPTENLIQPGVTKILQKILKKISRKKIWGKTVNRCTVETFCSNCRRVEFEENMVSLGVGIRRNSDIFTLKGVLRLVR